jgi:hypothetical protein
MERVEADYEKLFGGGQSGAVSRHRGAGLPALLTSKHEQ